MKSRPVGVENILATDHNTRRDDARGGSFLLPHQQLGAIALPTNPTNTQTLTLDINGTNVVVTFVSSIGSTANNVLIGASATATATNLVNFLRRPDITSSTQVAASAPNQALVQYLGWSWPGGATTIVPFSLNKNVNGATANLSSFTASTTVTGGSWTAQTMQLYVEDGTYFVNGSRLLFNGGSTPTVTAPGANPRIDILTIDSGGTLAWTTGTENASPTAPAYPANKIPLCELYNVVGETSLFDTENQQAGQGYIYNDVRPTLNYGANFGAFASDIVPDVTDTRSLGSNSVEFLNIYGKNVFQNGRQVSYELFNGSGADGTVTISSPTTLTRDMYYATLTVNSTLNTGGYRIFVSGTISGTGTITAPTPNAGGNASGATPGSAGAASISGYFKNYAGTAGVTGGSNSSSPTGAPSTIGVASGQGGAGGSASNPTGSAGTAGSGGTLKPRKSPRYGVIKLKSPGSSLNDGYAITAGTDMRSIFKWLQKAGAADFEPLENDVTLPLPQYCNPALVTPAIEANAAQSTIASYAFGNTDFASLCQAIYLNKAVLLLIKCDDGFWYTGSPTFTTPKYGHFVVADGYDQNHIRVIDSAEPSLSFWSSKMIAKQYITPTFILESGTALDMPIAQLQQIVQQASAIAEQIPAAPIPAPAKVTLLDEIASIVQSVEEIL